jgi:two-component system, sensor histidine kinase
MNLLIAEDDPSNRLILFLLTEYWGYNSDIVSNGKEAVILAKANEEQYDLCIMDLDMLIEDGYDATKIIHRQQEHLPILAIVSNAEHRHTYLKNGIDDILEKPYIPDSLYAKIKKLTGKRKKKDTIKTAP